MKTLFNFAVSYGVRLLERIIGSYDYYVIALLDALRAVNVVIDLAVVILNRNYIVGEDRLGQVILVEFLILAVVVSIVDLFISIIVNFDGECQCLGIGAVNAGLIHIIFIIPPSCFFDVIVEVFIVDSVFLAFLDCILLLDALKDIAAQAAVDNQDYAENDECQCYNTDCSKENNKSDLAVLLRRYYFRINSCRYGNRTGRCFERDRLSCCRRFRSRCRCGSCCGCCLNGSCNRCCFYRCGCRCRCCFNNGSRFSNRCGSCLYNGFSNWCCLNRSCGCSNYGCYRCGLSYGYGFNCRCCL